jgi:hypothetical protein
MGRLPGMLLAQRHQSAISIIGYSTLSHLCMFIDEACFLNWEI